MHKIASNLQSLGYLIMQDSGNEKFDVKILDAAIEILL